MYLFFLIGIVVCRQDFDPDFDYPIVDYQGYGDYGQYGPHPGNSLIPEFVYLYTDNSSSGDVGPLIVPSADYELMSVWVHRRQLTLVDEMIHHKKHSFAAALSKPLASFVDRFSIGEGADAADAPARPGAPSDDADTPASSGTASKRCSRADASATSGASFKRPSDDAFAGASASAPSDDAFAGASASVSSDRDVTDASASDQRSVFVCPSGEDQRPLVDASGFGGASSGIRLSKRVVLGGGRVTLEFDVRDAISRVRGWCYVMKLVLFVSQISIVFIVFRKLHRGSLLPRGST